MTREIAPPKLDASMFPTLPKQGTRTTSTKWNGVHTALPMPEPKPALHCDMCGNASSKPKCSRCWGIVAGLESLHRDNLAAFEAFVSTLAG